MPGRRPPSRAHGGHPQPAPGGRPQRRSASGCNTGPPADRPYAVNPASHAAENAASQGAGRPGKGSRGGHGRRASPPGELEALSGHVELRACRAAALPLRQRSRPLVAGRGRRARAREVRVSSTRTSGGGIPVEERSPTKREGVGVVHQPRRSRAMAASEVVARPGDAVVPCPADPGYWRGEEVGRQRCPSLGCRRQTRTAAARRSKREAPSTRRRPGPQAGRARRSKFTRRGVARPTAGSRRAVGRSRARPRTRRRQRDTPSLIRPRPLRGPVARAPPGRCSPTPPSMTPRRRSVDGRDQPCRRPAGAVRPPPIRGLHRWTRRRTGGAPPRRARSRRSARREADEAGPALPASASSTTSRPSPSSRWSGVTRPPSTDSRDAGGLRRRGRHAGRCRLWQRTRSERGWGPSRPEPAQPGGIAVRGDERGRCARRRGARNPPACHHRSRNAPGARRPCSSP